MFQFKYLTILIVIFSTITQSTSVKVSKVSMKNKFIYNKPECTDKKLFQLDRSAQKTFGIGINGENLPTNQKELTSYCRSATNTLNDFEKFLKDCFVSEVRDFGLLGIYSLKQTIKKICNKKKSKTARDILEVAPCLNKHVMPDFKCAKQFINSTVALKSTKDNKMKIPHICCQLHHAVNCADDAMQKIDCIRDKRNVLIDLVKSSTSSLTEVGCGEYVEGSDKCDNLGRLVANKNDKQKYKSFFMILIEVLDSMDEFTLAGN